MRLLTALTVVCMASGYVVTLVERHGKHRYGMAIPFWDRVLENAGITLLALLAVAWFVRLLIDLGLIHAPS